VLGQSRSTQRYVCQQPEIDKPLVQKLLSLHVKHPHYGYRRITIRLREKGWFVNFKRVYRLWCQEGLKIRKKQHKRRFEGSSKNACHRKRPAYKNHIWSYDFLSERLENGRLVKLLVVIDEYTRECLALDVNQSLRSQDVIEVLRYLFAVRGEPAYIRSDNGPEFTSTAVKTWLSHTNARTLFVAKSSPWETGYVESFNSKLRDELLNRELFLHLDELMYIVDCWRMDYNHYRPHSSLDYMAPAAFAATLAKNHSEPQSGKLPPCGPNLPDCRKDFLCQQNDRILS
jgi:transposase InsO family protein